MPKNKDQSYSIDDIDDRGDQISSLKKDVKELKSELNKMRTLLENLELYTKVNDSLYIRVKKDKK